MLERLPVRRHVRRIAMLALVVTVLAALSGLPAAAQATTTQSLDDTQVEFAQGTFQRTSVSAGIVPDVPQPFPDQDGTLELSSAGQLTPWALSATKLPVALAAMGVTSIGNKLYTVAGATGSGTDFTDAVYWASVDQQTGNLNFHNLTSPPPGANFPSNSAIWVNDPLPGAAAYMDPPPNPNPSCASELIQRRRAPAVASFVTGSGTNYIYAIGGAFNLSSQCGQGSLTSPAVQIGTVNAATGDITWTSGATQQANYLPSQNLPTIVSDWSDVAYISEPEFSYGVEGATASVVTAGGGQTYLYVIGGLISYDDGGGKTDLITPAVYYARIDPATGALVHPAGTAGRPWARAANVPLNTLFASPGAPGELGLYNHTAMVSQAAVGTGTGTTIRSAIYVTGGYTALGEVNAANATVFRATVNDDGSLVWATALNPDPTVIENVSIGTGRGEAAGFAFGNKLYVLGGRPNNNPATDPFESGVVGVHDDRLNMLPLFGAGSGSVYFAGGEGDLNFATYGHGATVITASPLPGATTIENAAWGYAVGGNGVSNQPTDEIYLGKIGGSGETQATVRIPDGWYYSRFFNIRFESENTAARILSVRWFTGIDRASNTNADLRIEFQRTKILPCNEAAFAISPWVPLDGNPGTGVGTETFSKNGFNEVKLRDIFPTEDFNASCMRYRVYMTQNGSTEQGVPNPAGDANKSPRLFSINVEKIKPGDPDLKLEAFEIGPDANGQISTFNLQLNNLNGTVLDTVPAQVQEFPVVLCVAYSPSDPNVALTVPTLPITGDTDNRVDCAPVYRFVEGAQTQPGQALNISAGEWRVNFANVPHIPGKGEDALLSSPQEAFAQVGYYAVAVLIDPYNLVVEGGSGKANNRGENLNNNQPLVRRFQISEPGFKTVIRLPMIRR